MTSRRASEFTSTFEGTKAGRRNVTVPFNEINEPGAYYCHTNGWLYRVPPEAVTPGHSPNVNVVSSTECYVTKVCDDPWVPVNKAREICSNWDFAVNF